MRAIIATSGTSVKSGQSCTLDIQLDLYIAAFRFERFANLPLAAQSRHAVLSIGDKRRSLYARIFRVHLRDWFALGSTRVPPAGVVVVVILNLVVELRQHAQRRTKQVVPAQRLANNTLFCPNKVSFPTSSSSPANTTSFCATIASFPAPPSPAL